MSAESRRFPPRAAARFLPLVGVIVGVGAAVVYWLGSQVWPASVAVVVSMFATLLVTQRIDGPCAPPERWEPLYWMFGILVKYNALMALSAASLPVALPAYLPLGLIMMAGLAASRALMVSVMATAPRRLGVTTHELVVALILGFAPATLLGLPGLIGLVSAILARLLLAKVRDRPELIQQFAEVCFYLGALASWRYV